MINDWVKHSGFYRQASESVLAAAVNQEIFSEKLPNGLSFKLTHLGTYVGALAAWGNLTWTIRLNGTPIYPFNNQLDQIGVQNEPIAIGEDFVFPPASVITVTVSNSDLANAYVAGIVLKGEYGYQN